MGTLPDPPPRCLGMCLPLRVTVGPPSPMSWHCPAPGHPFSIPFGVSLPSAGTGGLPGDRDPSSKTASRGRARSHPRPERGSGVGAPCLGAAPGPGVWARGVFPCLASIRRAPAGFYSGNVREGLETSALRGERGRARHGDVSAHGSRGLWLPAPYRIEMFDATKNQEPGARGAFNAPGAKLGGGRRRGSE